MEVEVSFKVQARNDPELARKIRGMSDLAKIDETTDTAEPDPVDSPPVKDEPDRPAAISGLIDVGEASGKRGDEVAIEIRGHADVPIMGVAIAVGFEAHHLDFVRAEWGPGLDDGFEIASAARGREHVAVGNAGAHVLLVMIRAKIRSGGPPAEAVEAPIDTLIKMTDEELGEVDGETMPPLMLAQGSLLATMYFGIKAAAPIGKTLPLLNRTNWFGKPRVIHTFGTAHDQPPRGGVYPELESGHIIVTG